MDWARAKNILIVILFALNIALAVTIVSRAISGGADSEFYVNIRSILTERGVEVVCDLPKQITSSEVLKYSSGVRFLDKCKENINKSIKDDAFVEKKSNELLVYTNTRPDENLSTVSITALDTAIRNIFDEWDVDLTNFITDYTTPNDDGSFIFKYVFEYKGKLVFDCNFNVYIDKNGGIEQIILNYREVKSSSNDKLMKVIPAYQVLLKNYYDSGDVIEAINIGFMGHTVRENELAEYEEGAVWRVRLKGGKERFFEATYGDEIILNP
jgi:hypothetical protein